MNTLRLALLLLATCLPGFAAGAASTTPADITRTVDGFLKNHDYGSRYPVEYDIKTLDRRLRLKPCNTPLSARFRDDRRTEGAVHVRVECEGDSPWHLHVSATVRVWVDAVAVSTPVARGATLTAQDLTYVKAERSRLYNGYFKSIEEVTGLSAAMPLQNDQIVHARHLRAPYLVNKGQKVTILARSGQIEIRARGQAMANASQGQNVTVRNMESGRVVDGVAVSRGTVQVPL